MWTEGASLDRKEKSDLKRIKVFIMMVLIRKKVRDSNVFKSRVFSLSCSKSCINTDPREGKMSHS